MLNPKSNFIQMFQAGFYKTYWPVHPNLGIFISQTQKVWQKFFSLYYIKKKKGAEIEIKTSVKQYVRSNLTYSLVTDCDPFNRACKKPKEKIIFCRSLWI